MRVRLISRHLASDLNMRTNFASVLLFGCLLFAHAVAADIADGIDAREEGDFHSALQILIVLALDDNVEAIHEVGVTYAKMNDHRTASIWIGEAAKRGLAKSQSALGSMYAIGLGVQEDEDRSLYWLQMAAEQGDQQSKTALELMKADSGSVTMWDCVTKEAGPTTMIVSSNEIIVLYPDAEETLYSRMESIDPAWITGATQSPSQNLYLEVGLEPLTGKQVFQLLALDTREVAYSISGTCTQSSD